MSSKVLLECQNGFGDKVLDIIGFSLFCEYYKLSPVINWNPKITHFQWGNNDYDLRLMKFDKTIEFTLNSRRFENHIISPNPSSSLSPYKVFSYLKKTFPDVTFEEISNRFAIKAKEWVKASSFVEQCIPEGIERAYGIHLRYSDKVKERYDPRFEHNQEDFMRIRDFILKDAEIIIQSEEYPIFLVVSEDSKWRHSFLNLLVEIGDKHNKHLIIIEPQYIDNNDINDRLVGLESVVDMFCLSRCKMIFQGVKYSSFSILAALLGSNKLINYTSICEQPESCLIHSWNSVIEINGSKILDEDIQKRISDTISDIRTS